MYQEVTKENFWNAVSWPKSQFIEIDIWNVWSSIFYQYRGVFSGFHARFLGHIINSSFWTYAPHWPLTYHLHYHLEKVVANVTWLSGVVKSHHIKEVVNVTFWQWGGETLILHWGWWTSGVVIVLGGERLRWWMSEVVNVWGGECLGWWTSDFTLGVVNVWGGECLGWWTSEVVNVWGGERLGWWTSDFTLGVVNVWGGERLNLHWLAHILDEQDCNFFISLGKVVL